VCPPPLRWIDGIVDWAILPFQSLSLLLVIIKSLVHPTLTKNWYVILVKGPRVINSLIQDHLVCQKNPLELVYSGVWGPAPTSAGRKNYYVSFIDDYSKYTWIYLLKDISEVFQKFHEFQSLVERMLGRKIIVMQTGWGGGGVSKVEYLLSTHWHFPSCCREQAPTHCGSWASSLSSCFYAT
jgi:hypothetical protein